MSIDLFPHKMGAYNVHDRCEVINEIFVKKCQK